MPHWRKILGAGLLPALFACGGGNVEPKAKIVPMAQIREALRPQGKPLFVNHWATWCLPCVEELPELAKLARRYEGRVDFVGVSWDLLTGGVTAEEAKRKVEEVSGTNGIPYDSFVPEGSAETLAQTLGLEDLTVPQTHIFDREGKRIASFEVIHGDEDRKAVEEVLDRLLR